MSIFTVAYNLKKFGVTKSVNCLMWPALDSERRPGVGGGRRQWGEALAGWGVGDAVKEMFGFGSPSSSNIGSSSRSASGLGGKTTS